MFPQANIILNVEDINATATVFNSPERETKQYNLIGSKTKTVFYNKEILDSSNSVAANFIKSDNNTIKVSGTPASGDVLTAVDTTNASWQPQSAGTVYSGRYIYVSLNAPAGGDGTPDNPYNDLTPAFARSGLWTIIVGEGSYMGSYHIGTYKYLMGTGNVYINELHLNPGTTGTGLYYINNVDIDVFNYDLSTSGPAAFALLDLRLTNVNVFNIKCPTNLYSSVTMNACKINSIDTENFDVNIINSNIGTVNATGKIKGTWYNSRVEVFDGTTISGGPLIISGTTVSGGSLTGTCPVSRDPLARMSLANGMEQYTDIPMYNVMADNIAIGVRQTLLNAGSPAITDSTIIGSGATFTNGVIGSVALGAGAAANLSNMFALPDNITVMKAKGIAGVASGLNLVFDTTTGHIQYATSSREHKKNISPHDIHDSLELISEMAVNKFTWKETEEDDIGFIADELHALDPRLSTVDENGIPCGVNHVRMTPHIIAGIQAMISHIGSTVEEIDTMKLTIEKSEKLIKKQSECIAELISENSDIKSRLDILEELMSKSKIKMQ